MVKVSEFFDDLPVKIDSDDYKKITGIALDEKVKHNTELDLVNFLDRVHENLYYGLIYTTGGKTLKDNMITKHIIQLEKPIKLSLVAQANYMLNSGGDYGTEDGSSTNADGTLNIVDPESIKAKLIAPKVYSILRNTRPNLILGV